MDRIRRALRLTFVLERQLDARAIRDDLAVFHREVELRDFRDAQVAQCLAGGCYCILRCVFPRYPARADHFGDAIDAFSARFLRHGVFSLVSAASMRPRLDSMIRALWTAGSKLTVGRRR